METERKKLGNLGEDLACEHLTSLGHVILDRNWRYGHLEIDIVSADQSGLHFVEVKSRVAPVSASPEDNVGYRKQKRLTAAANAYLNIRKPGDMEVSFDVVTVVFDGEKTDLTYFNQAFIPIHV